MKRAVFLLLFAVLIVAIAATSELQQRNRDRRREKRGGVATAVAMSVAAGTLLTAGFYEVIKLTCAGGPGADVPVQATVHLAMTSTASGGAVAGHSAAAGAVAVHHSTNIASVSIFGMHLSVPPAFIVSAVIYTTYLTRSYWLPYVSPPFIYVGKEISAHTNQKLKDKLREAGKIISDGAHKINPIRVIKAAWTRKSVETTRNVTRNLTDNILREIHQLIARYDVNGNTGMHVKLGFDMNSSLNVAVGSDYKSPRLIWLMSGLRVSPLLFDNCTGLYNTNSSGDSQAHCNLKNVLNGHLNLVVDCSLGTKETSVQDGQFCDNSNIDIDLDLDTADNDAWAELIERDLPKLIVEELSKYLQQGTGLDKQYIVKNLRNLPRTTIADSSSAGTDVKEESSVKSINAKVEVIKSGLFDRRWMADQSLQTNANGATLKIAHRWSSLPFFTATKRFRKVCRTRMWLSNDNSVFNMKIENQMFKMTWNFTTMYEELLTDINVKCKLSIRKDDHPSLSCPVEDIIITETHDRGYKGKSTKTELSLHYFGLIRTTLKKSIEDLGNPDTDFYQERFEFKKLLSIWTKGSYQEKKYLQNTMCGLKVNNLPKFFKKKFMETLQREADLKIQERRLKEILNELANVKSGTEGQPVNHAINEGNRLLEAVKLVEHGSVVPLVEKGTEQEAMEEACAVKRITENIESKIKELKSLHNIFQEMLDNLRYGNSTALKEKLKRGGRIAKRRLGTLWDWVSEH